MPMPNRHTTDNNYSYAFQGQEKDSETGMEAFQLRLWDGRIGRWLNPDPYGQYHSPYLGMGNNPISSIDPDGGWSVGGGGPPGFFARLWNRITGNDNEYTEIPKEESFYMELSEVVVTASPTHISNGLNSHLIYSEGYDVDYGDLGSTTNGGLALPYDFGDWNSAGSDGRQWIGCMACHGINGAYNTLAYNSPSTRAGYLISALLPVGVKGIKLGATKGGSITLENTVGAAKAGFSKNSFKAVDSKFLSKNGITNIHDFKEGFLGRNVILKHFDVVRHTQTGELLIIRQSTKEIIENTGIITQ
jgi:RHS repeat-associated protein